jgi:hypothetical protein
LGGEQDGEPADATRGSGHEHPPPRTRPGGAERLEGGEPATGSPTASAASTDAGNAARAATGTTHRPAKAPGATATTRLPAGGPVPSDAGATTTPATSDPSTPPTAMRPDLASFRSPWFSET